MGFSCIEVHISNEMQKSGNNKTLKLAGVIIPVIRIHCIIQLLLRRL